MFFELKDGSIINVNAILRLPSMGEGEGDLTRGVEMVDGGQKFIHVNDIRELRILVMSP